MRKPVKVATLSLAVFAGACGTSKKTATMPEDLQKDLAAASAPASDFATAPKSFEPTRVVSEMERTSAPIRIKTLTKTKRKTKPMPRPEPKDNGVEVAAADTPGNTEMAPSTVKAPVPSDVPEIPEPVATSPEPGSDPAPSPVPGSVGSGNDGRGRGRGRGIGGLGGILGGIFGGVVIRGGHGGVDKCDPRTDGRSGGIFIMGPNSGMPRLPAGTFPRRLAGQSRRLY